MKQWVMFLLCCVKVRSQFDSGYPAGYMADCPGMNRTTTLSTRTADSLVVTVYRPSSGRFTLDGGSRKCKMSKGGVACVDKHLDLGRKTKIMVSGYLDHSYSPFIAMFKTLELERGWNVITLEIFPVLFRSYPIAARTTKPLGHRLGEFLGRLSQRGLNPENLELLGGSLGAHVAHYAAVRYWQLTGQRPARLTGLDPAGPCFRNLPASAKFNKNSAVRVDALHTNIDGFGIAEPVAHVDFYANGGEFQPSIAGNFILPCFQLCSHVRAALYWISANQSPDKFLAVRCPSVANARHGDCFKSNIVTNPLGPKTNFSRPGVYYLPVREAAPYHLDKEGLRRRKYGLNNYLIKASGDVDLEL